MAKAEDFYIVTLRKTHLEWGTHRYTGSRDQIYGEGYIPIPSIYAYRFGLLNSNGTKTRDILGENIFKCRSADNLFQGTLRAQGCRTAGDKYAKQFSGDGDLKSLGTWFSQIDVVEGDNIKVRWISPTEIEIEIL
ncbi:hypothetical protein BXY41_1056 [Lacrimispora xylanisolvens]|uniref:Uncharacterized protein n=1 Tax=Lacrimispora xylanisolvens TaxID=384636 RepID=A0A2S6HSS1_9FIRM|nr:hypothetical protein [Hungatella xylanolytica]PPK80793.1 hypothetical protein BXY41_1056 [Hungatella xylanolytica]